MIWIRAGLLAFFIGVLVLAMNQATSQPTSSPVAAQAAPTQPPTRVPLPTAPLPTAPPQMVISRVARETPAPRATATPLAQPRVSVVDNGFLPARLSVRVGSRVTWINFGSDGHDVTGNGPGGAWHSGPLAPSERYERSFALPGTYDYVCSIHPEMRGRLVVVQP